MDELYKRLDGHRFPDARWRDVFHDGWMDAACADARARPTAALLASAGRCWDRLAGEPARRELALCCRSDNTGSFRGAEHGRLHANALSRFALGVCAALLRAPGAAAEHLPLWLGRAAGCAEPPAPAPLPELLTALPPGPRARLAAGLAPLAPEGLPRGHAPAAPHLVVPFATYNDRAASIFELLLWRLGGDDADLVEHPDVWNVHFCPVWLDALRAARARSGVRGAVLWSVRPHRAAPTDTRRWKADPLAFTGGSHGLAAHVGLEILSTGGRLLPTDLLAAAVDGDGRAVGVLSLCPKAVAARAAGFRRLVVAARPQPGEFDLSDTEVEALGAGANPVAVVRCADVGAAVAVADEWNTGLRRYLEAVRDRAVVPGAFAGAAGAVFAPDVYPAGDPREPGGPARLGVAAEGDEHVRPDRLDGAARVPWARALGRAARAVVLGRPGSGKTVLCQLTLRWLAARGAGRARATDIPVYARLDAVAETGSLEGAVRAALPLGLPGGFTDELCAHLLKGNVWLVLDGWDEVAGPDRRAAVRRELARLHGAACRAIVTSRPWGYRRAELPLENPAEYELAPLSRRQQRRFLARWASAAASPGGPVAPAAAARLRRLLRADPSMATVGRSPLLLALAFAAAGGGEPGGGASTRAWLYERMVAGLLRGAWRDGPSPDGTRQAVELVALTRLAWRLFRRGPGRASFDVARDLVPAAEAALRGLLGDGVLGFLERLEARGVLIPVGPGRLAFAHRSLLDFLAARHLAGRPWEGARRALARFLGAGGPARGPWEPAAAEVVVFLAGVLGDPAPLVRHLVACHDAAPDALGALLLLAGRCAGEVGPRPGSEAWAGGVTDRLFAVWQRLGCPDALAPGFAHPAGVRQLRAAVDTAGLEVRARAVRALGRIGSPGAVRALIRFGRSHPEPRAADEVARALGRIGTRRAVEYLVKRLHDPQEQRPHPLVRALLDTEHPHAVRALLGLIEGPEVGQAARAALRFLPTVPSARVRTRVERALQERRALAGERAHVLPLYGDRRAWRQLLDHVRGPGAGHADASALGRALEYAAPLPPWLERRAVELLDHPLEPALMARLVPPLAAALGRSGRPAAVRALNRLLETDAFGGRLPAALALGRAGAAGAREWLLPYLRGRVAPLTPLERVQVLGALVRLREPGAEDELLNLIRTSPLAVRSRAVAALGEALDPRPLPDAVLNLLADPAGDPLFRRDLLWVLERRAEPGALARVLVCVLAADPDRNVRAAAALALGRLGDEAAVPALLHAAQADAGVAGAVADAISALLPVRRFVPADGSGASAS